MAHLASEPLAERHEMSDSVRLCMLMAMSFGEMLTAYSKLCLILSRHHNISRSGFKQVGIFLPLFLVFVKEVVIYFYVA